MKTKRLASIELIRIIACFFVVALHALEDIFSSANPNFFETCLLSLLFTGVTLFWFITGFFLFENNDYPKLLKKTFKRIWLPSFIINIVCVLLYDFYLFYTDGINMLDPISYIISFINNALRFRTFAPSCTHFWFIYTYCLIIVIYPVLKSFVDYLDQNKERQKTFVIVSIILIVINEITFNDFACISNHGFSAVVMASIEIILGHIIYNNKDKLIKNNLFSIFGLIAFILIRSVVYVLLKQFGLSLEVIYSWYSIFGILIALSLITVIINIVDDNKESAINQFLQESGKLTLYIYMLHKIPIKILRKIGIENIIINSNIVIKYLLMFIYALACFAITMLISYIFVKLKNCFSKNKNKQKIGE